jgi:hypothetical protein
MSFVAGIFFLPVWGSYNPAASLLGIPPQSSLLTSQINIPVGTVGSREIVRPLNLTFALTGEQQISTVLNMSMLANIDLNGLDKTNFDTIVIGLDDAVKLPVRNVPGGISLGKCATTADPPPANSTSNVVITTATVFVSTSTVRTTVTRISTSRVCVSAYDVPSFTSFSFNITQTPPAWFVNSEIEYLVSGDFGATVQLLKTENGSIINDSIYHTPLLFSIASYDSILSQRNGLLSTSLTFFIVALAAFEFSRDENRQSKDSGNDNRILQNFGDNP